MIQMQNTAIVASVLISFVVMHCAVEDAGMTRGEAALPAPAPSPATTKSANPYELYAKKYANDAKSIYFTEEFLSFPPRMQRGLGALFAPEARFRAQHARILEELTETDSEARLTTRVDDKTFCVYLRLVGTDTPERLVEPIARIATSSALNSSSPRKGLCVAIAQIQTGRPHAVRAGYAAARRASVQVDAMIRALAYVQVDAAGEALLEIFRELEVPPNASAERVYGTPLWKWKLALAGLTGDPTFPYMFPGAGLDAQQREFGVSHWSEALRQRIVAALSDAKWPDYTADWIRAALKRIEHSG